MRDRLRHLLTLFPALALAVTIGSAGCDAAQRDDPTRDDPTRPTTVSVFAAASLTESFQALAEAFEAAHPQVVVGLTFAGSQVLRLQIEHGAEADLFASANPAHMTALVQAGLIAQTATFARNQLVLIVPRESAAGIETFRDLARADAIVIGSDNVPIGQYTRQVFERAAERFGPDFTAAAMGRVVSEESNVRLVRAKVALGEADAALVYRTDAHGFDDVRAIPIPKGLNVQADYPIGVTTGARQASLARDFLAFVLGEDGQRILAAHGFDRGAL